MIEKFYVPTWNFEDKKLVNKRVNEDDLCLVSYKDYFLLEEKFKRSQGKIERLCLNLDTSTEEQNRNLDRIRSLEDTLKLAKKSLGIYNSITGIMTVERIDEVLNEKFRVKSNRA